MTVHTILLAQPTPNPGSRTYYDFETVALSLEHIMRMFEQRLTNQNPNVGHIQYSADDLMSFLDTYKEFVALVFDPPSKNYIPHDKAWIKERLVSHLKRSMRQNQQGGYNNGGRW